MLGILRAWRAELARYVYEELQRWDVCDCRKENSNKQLLCLLRVGVRKPEPENCC